MKLIEIGLTLFAEKGYHATSISEIAKQAGISKGAFYLYFQSKEDFVTTAFQYFHEKISEQMEKVDESHDDPRISLASQITVLTEFIYSYKGFITMHLRENISISGKTDELIKQMKVENFYWLRSNLLAIYGEKVSPILLDCIIQLEGLINSYFKWIVIDDINIDRSKVGGYIVRRIDQLIQAMLEEGEEPLATIDNFPKDTEESSNVQHMLNKLREKIKTLPLDQSKLSDLNEVLDEIEVEMTKEEPKKLLIQGFLAHVQRYPVLQEECEQIAKQFDIELLD